MRETPEIDGLAGQWGLRHPSAGKRKNDSACGACGKQYHLERKGEAAPTLDRLWAAGDPDVTVPLGVDELFAVGVVGGGGGDTAVGFNPGGGHRRP